jgi:hypothetical protein
VSEGTLSAGSVSLGVKPDATGFAGELKSKLLGGMSGIGGQLGEGLMGGLKAMAGPIAAIGAGFAIGDIVEKTTKSFEDLAGQVKSMQRVTGGTTEEVSGLQGAMKLAGVSADNTAMMFTRFEKGLVAAESSGKKTAAMSKLLGTNILDANGHVKSMSELLPAVADRFKEMPAGAEKTALAVQLFGRSGTQLLPVLNKGADGIAELTAKAKDMGLVIDDAAMEKFNESRKSQREWQATMQGLSVTLGQIFLPILEAVQGSIREVFIPMIEKATKFVHDHQKQFDDLGKTLKGIVMPIIEDVASAIGNLISWVMQNKDALIMLGVAIAAGVIAFQGYNLIMGIVEGAQKAWLVIQGLFKVVTGEATLAQMGFNASLLANPIGLVIAAIAALVAGLIWFFTQTKLGQDIWKNFTSFLGTAVKNIGNFFHDTFTAIGGWITGVFEGAIGTVKGFLNGIIDMINGIIGGINSMAGAIKLVTGGAVNLSIGKIPHLAEGGIVPATPGGRLVRVAEAGQAEAVIPLDKLGSAGKGATINYYAAPNDSISAERKLIDAVQRAKVLGAIA